jgi:hypothetical protein
VGYLIFCVNAPTPTRCDSMGEAINTACKLIRAGIEVRQIEGSNGFLMERNDIEFECLRRTADRQ